MIEAIFALSAFVIGLISIFLLVRFHAKKKLLALNYARKKKVLIVIGGGFGMVAPLWIFCVAFAIISGITFQTTALMLLVTAFAIIGYIDDRKPKFIYGKGLGWKIRALPIAIISLLFAYFFAPQPQLLWLIPIALFVAGITSFTNTFEGLNGWGIGSGFIMLAFISSILALHNNPLSTLGFALTGIVLAFLMFNKYPAKSLPGDSGTLFVGSSIAALTLVSGEFWLIVLCVAFHLFHFIDFFALKMYSNSKDLSQSKQLPYKVLADERLTIPKGKITIDFAKLLFKIFGPLREWQVVLIIWVIVAANAIFWTAIFLNLKLI